MLPGRLGELLAHDIMTRNVVSLPEKMEIDDAISTLKKEHITGAPVVSASGILVGILSLNDLVNLHAGELSTDHSPPVALAPGADKTPWSLFQDACSLNQANLQHENEAIVANSMTTHVTSVKESATLLEVAQLMCDGHWHRVPVIDSEGKLTGIISSMDIMAALVNASEETT